jgi:hypothetical protein
LTKGAERYTFAAAAGPEGRAGCHPVPPKELIW